MRGQQPSRRRDRRGQAAVVPIILVIAGLSMLLAEAAIYEGVAQDQMRQQIDRLMEQNIDIEGLISAPCATRSRGVFYRSSILSGDFECITPRMSLYLNFTVGSSFHLWQVNRMEDGGISVSRPSGDIRLSQRVPVMVYDEQAGTVERGTLRMGAVQNEGGGG